MRVRRRMLMMSNVVDLAAARAEREPHTSGPCLCLGCRHEWFGVIPTGVDVVDCPSCGLEKGIRRGLIGPPECALVWTCDCGNTYLLFTPLGCMCPVCGLGWDRSELWK